MKVRRTITTDILVVGGGNAGLAAAIEGRNRGARVLLLEKGIKEKRGGNSRFSGGHFRISMEGTKDFSFLLKDSVLPKGELVIEPYKKDQYYADLMRVTEGYAEQWWVEKIVNDSFASVTWMKEQGMVWGLNPGYMVTKGDKQIWPSGVAVLTAGNSGEGLVEMLYAIAEARKTDIMYETAARSILVNEEGEVYGIVAMAPEGMIQIEAPSVILACGGFEGSTEMRRRYLGEGWDLVKLRGTRYNTGDGLRMAIDIGAQTAGHWGGCHASVVSEDSPMIEAEAVGCIRYSYLYGIMVNTEGRRFVDEGENFIVYTYAKYGKQIARQPAGVAFQIFDSKVLSLLRPEYQNAVKAVSTTLEGLAEEIGIDPKALVATVEDYNKSIKKGAAFDPAKRDGLCTNGLDPDKSNWAQPIDTPPYEAYACVCGITFSYGGVRVNEKTEVLDTRGMPIVGLYAIGEMSGGVFHFNYPSGTGLVKGTITGRMAAAEAAHRAGFK